MESSISLGSVVRGRLLKMASRAVSSQNVDYSPAPSPFDGFERLRAAMGPSEGYSGTLEARFKGLVEARPKL
jgi:hypothetical protein